MQKAKKFLIAIVCISLLFYFLNNRYNIYDIDNLAYVIALGFDVGTNNVLKISFQVSALGSSSGESGKAKSDNPKVNTVECSSLENGINIMNSYLSKDLNLAHCKMIVFSEELASMDISDQVYTLINNDQIRSDSNILISRCNAEYFLNNSKPILESLAAKYYETVPLSSEYTGYTQNVTLKQFFIKMSCKYQNPVAILGNVNSTSSHTVFEDLSNLDQDSNYKAGQTNINHSSNEVETIGLAVFKDENLVGELTAFETLCHLIVTNQINRAQITLPNPFVQNESVTLLLKPTNNFKKDINIVNSTPYISISPNFEANILTSNKHTPDLTQSQIETIEEYAMSFLNSKISEYLYKTSKQFKSDIDEFGQYASKYFLYTKDWENFDWNSAYENAFFNIDSKIRIVSS